MTTNRHNFNSANARKHWERSIETLKSLVPAEIAQRIVEFDELVPHGSRPFTAYLDDMQAGQPWEDCIESYSLLAVYAANTFSEQFSSRERNAFLTPLKDRVLFMLKSKNCPTLEKGRV